MATSVVMMMVVRSYSYPATLPRSRTIMSSIPNTSSSSPSPSSSNTHYDSNISITTKHNNTNNRKLPILLFDIMDTIVRDPFYEDVPAFFGMSLKELIECKHPTAWIEFEKGHIDEMELAAKFFKDGHSFDLEGLKDSMRRGYSYLEGAEELLRDLKRNNYEMHAFTNYPIWYELIEEKLKLSNYLSWTFCSCTYGKRKPDPDFFSDAIKQLEVDPSSCIFVDDRLRNVEAASEVGLVGLQFRNADLLRQDLCDRGINISGVGHSRNQDDSLSL